MRYALIGTVAATLLLATESAAAQEADGQAIYRQECKSCHGLNGVPPSRAREQYKKIKALDVDGFVSKLSVDSIVTILKKGISKDMKSFTGKLSDPEMRAVTIRWNQMLLGATVLTTTWDGAMHRG